MMAEKRPNILFIQCDQMTAFALSAYGNRTTQTPHIDALAAIGTTFRNAYCNFPICAPSRASMLTSQLASRIGVWDNGAEFNASIPTVAHYLGSLGYRTILSGKMHFIGPDQLHGFQERLTTDIYPADFSWTADWMKPGPPEAGSQITLRGVVEAGVCTRSLQIDFDEEVAFHAVSKLYDLAREPETHPFFLTVSFSHPHNPFTISQKYWDLYENVDIDRPHVDPIPLLKRDPHSQRLHYLTHADEHDVSEKQTRIARRAYYGMVSYIDEKVGALINALQETGLAQSTIIVFTSDHGEMLGERGMWYKMSLFEPSVRVPLIIFDPRLRQPRIANENSSLLDIVPTLFELAGGSVGSFPPQIEGRSLRTLLEGNQPDRPNVVYAEYTADGAIAPCFMVREDNVKMIWSAEDGTQLFDLTDDPHEQRNLCDEADFQKVKSHLLDRIHSNWDPARTKERILESQQSRLIFSRAYGSRGAPSWDFEPRTDVSRRFVRTGLSPAVTKGKARFPRVNPAAPDHPRRGR
jgi:choline-sulfatase